MLKQHFYLLATITACAFLGFIIWVIYLANTGGNSIFFDIIKHIPYGDKVGHCLLFGVLTYLANLTLQFNTIRLGSLPLYMGSCLVGLFVLVEEMSQGFIPRRTLDIADLAADGVGIMLFSYFTWLTHKYVRSFHQGENNE
ncbi:VanZ family protein [Shewanella sp. OMA3-2]|uniref:VanZ family protein n=1 Tax=Shewanella sp. OMA3-2 TaxID=2908650 RepID=UPI001F3E0D64|nr:VanZ family protein [Shewanella sp. OMA3-2]UJF21522.1 VanZ family protein [Shewanella sp. OMA3-2]